MAYKQHRRITTICGILHKRLRTGNSDTYHEVLRNAFLVKAKLLQVSYHKLEEALKKKHLANLRRQKQAPHLALQARHHHLPTH